jgi:hypothetical protein
MNNSTSTFDPGGLEVSARTLVVALGPEDFTKHRQMVRRVFLPETETAWVLVERLAKATWRRMRLLRARVRLEIRVWQRWASRPVKAPRFSLEETIGRARLSQHQTLVTKVIRAEKVDGRRLPTSHRS